MSSQKQCHRTRSMFGHYWDTEDEVNYLRACVDQHKAPYLRGGN